MSSLTLKLVPVPCDSLNRPSVKETSNNFCGETRNCYRPIIHPIFPGNSSLDPVGSKPKPTQPSTLVPEGSRISRNHPANSIPGARISDLNPSTMRLPPINSEILKNLYKKPEVSKETPYFGPVRQNSFMLDMDAKESELEVFYSNM